MKGFETGIEKCARIYTRDTKVRIVWGDKCATDGKGTIYLPALSDLVPPSIINRTRLNMGHEVSHVLHSDFSSIERALKTGGKGKKHILNAVEDVRIERLWELEYTGCQDDFCEDYKHFVKSEFNTRLKGPETIFSKVLNLLTIRSREKQLGFKSGLVVPADIEALFQDKLGDLVDEVASLKTMGEVEAITEVIYNRFKEESEEEDSKEGEKSDGSSSEDGDPSDSGPGDGSDEESDPGPESDKADDEPSPGEDGGSSKDDGADEESDGKPEDSPSESEGDSEKGAEEKPAPKKPKDPLEELKEKLKEEMEEGEPVKTIQDSRSEKINEFAITSQEYLVDPGVKDNIFKPIPSTHAEERAKVLMEDGKKILAFMGQRLQHLFVSKQSRRVTRFLKTGPLDSYRIMEDESDLICKRKLKGRKQDAVVGFSIDKSSSMQSDGKDDLATKLSLATGFFLEQIKVPFMALGLSSPVQHGPTRTYPVDIGVLKEFNESIQKVKGRFTSMRMSQNSDLDGLKLLAQQILMRPEPKKVIFVFSDGQPCSGGHEFDAKHMYSYKEYIKRLQRVGVIVFGFGIEYDVEHIFGKEYSITVNSYNLSTFPKIVFQQLSRILLE